MSESHSRSTQQLAYFGCRLYAENLYFSFYLKEFTGRRPDVNKAIELFSPEQSTDP
jgi:hypothetical protein